VEPGVGVYYNDKKTEKILNRGWSHFEAR
jgi:hypothetical protein